MTDFQTNNQPQTPSGVGNFGIGGTIDAVNRGTTATVDLRASQNKRVIQSLTASQEDFKNIIQTIKKGHHTPHAGSIGGLSTGFSVSQTPQKQRTPLSPELNASVNIARLNATPKIGAKFRQLRLNPQLEQAIQLTISGGDGSSVKPNATIERAGRIADQLGAKSPKGFYSQNGQV
ncbi:hypothetical protein FGO68_gene11558 [Halteria grandinella]|uniref:Uncharacterized protein n=1 Tax=Halteria grandinella TaxID=5974 RepID=A0A8J8T1B5_HALGN|nr:hypothetical protein FGO68_gene11558 [Halteria grandinella]